MGGNWIKCAYCVQIILKYYLTILLTTKQLSLEIVTTGGFRQSNNGNKVIDGIKNTVSKDLNIKIIDGCEESNTTFSGILIALNGSNTKYFNSNNNSYHYYSNIDIGSSSTEIAIKKST